MVSHGLQGTSPVQRGLEAPEQPPLSCEFVHKPLSESQFCVVQRLQWQPIFSLFRVITHELCRYLFESDQTFQTSKGSELRNPNGLFPENASTNNDPLMGKLLEDHLFVSPTAQLLGVSRRRSINVERTHRLGHTPGNESRHP